MTGRLVGDPADTTDVEPLIFLFIRKIAIAMASVFSIFFLELFAVRYGSKLLENAGGQPYGRFYIFIK